MQPHVRSLSVILLPVVLFTAVGKTFFDISGKLDVMILEQIFLFCLKEVKTLLGHCTVCK